NAFVKHTQWSSKKSHPLIIANSSQLEKKLFSDKTYRGITATTGGFYAPQGRVLRLGLQDAKLNSNMDSFNFNGNRITNLEMETSAIYGLSKLMGHNACSINAIIANRASRTFSKNPDKVVANLITYTLDKLTD
ncbi:MAG: phosphorylase family protein, partial [Polaribacter sp.]